MNNDRQKLIIDCDPGIDDAITLGFALFNPQIKIELITTVAGNANLKDLNQNVLKLLTFWDKNIDVASGASNGLIEKDIRAQNIHGQSGLQGYELPQAKYQLQNIHAVEAMAKKLATSQEKITILAIGPLTNIALLLVMYPNLKAKIKHLIMMGGSLSRGNKTVMGEFNIASDPEAAKIVFASNLKMTLVPLDIGQKALIKKVDLAKIKQANHTGIMFDAFLRNYRGGSLAKGLKMYDPCALAYLTNPEMFNTKEVFADVETQGTLTRGTTVIDLKNYLHKPFNLNVCVDIDVQLFNAWFFKALNNCC